MLADLAQTLWLHPSSSQVTYRVQHFVWNFIDGRSRQSGSRVWSSLDESTFAEAAGRMTNSWTRQIQLDDILTQMGIGSDPNESSVGL